MRPLNYTGWLRPKLAKRMSRLARTAGRDPGDLHALLTDLEMRGVNLSCGIFENSKLIGYLVARLDRDAEPAIRISDFVFDRRARHCVGTLLTRVAAVVRARHDLRDLPIHVAVPAANSHRWLDRPGLLKRMGYRLMPGTTPTAILEPVRAQPSVAPHQLVAQLTGVRIYRTPDGELSIGVIESYRDWALLEPWWNTFAAASPGATVFQSYEYLRTWWTLRGWGVRLWIAVALRGGEPVAIAPMQLASHPWSAFAFRRLSFLGVAPEADRPTVLAPPSEAAAIDALAQYVLDNGGEWEQLALAEQHPDSTFARAINQHCGSRWLRGDSAAGDCLSVAIEGSWAKFLEGRSKAVRKSIKRKLAALADAGQVQFELVSEATEVDAALERYLEVERASWKAGSAIGVSQTAAHVAFYHDLARRMAAEGRFEFRFLSLNGRTIAATFGLIWSRRFYSLHIAYEEAAAEHSPGVVLTAKELEEAFTNHRYGVFDFLTGALSNQASWATHRQASRDVYLNRRSVAGLCFHAYRFRLRPALRNALIRTNTLQRALALKNGTLKLLGRDPQA